MAAGASPELEVELSVRATLYGARDEVTVTRTARRPLGARDGGALDRLVGNRYRLLRRVGAGAMAEVYRARDERLKREVAVKVISERFAHVPTYVRRFRQEAELAARLAHPNVVAILDAGVEPRDFVVMELVDGLDAGRLLQSEGRLMPAEAVHVVAQVCDALEHVHRHGVVHNDVSPRNILIGRPGMTAKLADFGLAADTLDARAGRQGEITGTPGYVAPEILHGAGPSAGSDLYSLGVVAYRLLAGLSRPRDADATAPSATAGPRMAPLGRVRPGLSASLTDAIEQARAVDPNARQDSIALFRAQLIGERQAPPIRAELPRAA